MTSSPERWLEVSVAPPSFDGGDGLVADALVDLGGRAVETRDGRLVTHLAPDGPTDDPRPAILAFLEEVGVSEGDVVFRWQDHADWAEAWKAGLDTRRLTDRIVVTPTWIPVSPAEGEVVVTVDPGMAFGTAEHGTTRGCLRLLDAAVEEGDHLLDVGAGSAILAIAAALLGAHRVVAIEGDPLATDAIRENIERNGVADRVAHWEAWAHPGMVAAAGPVDGVMANIESGILRPLLPGFHGALRPGGWLILSGILASEWPAMKARTEGEGFRFLQVDADGEWRSGLFLRDDTARGG